MSALWVTLITFCIVSCTALSDQGSSSSSSSSSDGGVTWRTTGTSVTITCSPSVTDPLESLSLDKGLHKKAQVFNLDKSGKVTIKEELQARLTYSGQMGKLDVTVSNLTLADTGLYKCIYTTMDENVDLIETNGGSVLLVVEKAGAMPCEAQPSDPGSSQTPTVLLVVCAVTAGSVLLICLIALFMWGIPRVKSYFSSFSPATRQRVNTNDVYEDMRSTMRRRDDRPVRGQQQPLAQHP